MSTSVKGAQRVTRALGGIKWVLVTMWLVWGLLAILAIWEATTWPVATMVMVAVVAQAGAAFAWVAVGWMQHVLGMLVVVANGNNIILDIPTVGDSGTALVK